MKKTSLGLKKPEGTDLVNIQDMNDNMDVIEKELQARVKTTGDIKDTTVTFTQASSRANIVTGEKMAVIMGKIKKFFADLTAPAFAQMITTKADLMATKATGYVPDAKAVADAVSEVNGNLNAPFRTATKSYTITPSAAKSVINLSFDLSDIILDGYSASDIIVTSVNYTGSHEYQQVTITDANSQLTGTARIMAETTVEFSIRFTVLLYKKSAFNI